MQTSTNSDIYIRDASGNVLAVYRDDGTDITQRDIYLYGLSRIGGLKPDRNISTPSSLSADEIEYTSRRYELSNHLGNVLSMVSGRRLGVDDRQGVSDS